MSLNRADLLLINHVPKQGLQKREFTSHFPAILTTNTFRTLNLTKSNHRFRFNLIERRMEQCCFQSTARRQLRPKELMAWRKGCYAKRSPWCMPATTTCRFLKGSCSGFNKSSLQIHAPNLNLLQSALRRTPGTELNNPPTRVGVHSNSYLM